MIDPTAYLIFLGASHSPEQTSVMRPVLGDRQAVRKGFEVRFDPVNTLVISMVGETIPERRGTVMAFNSTAQQLGVMSGSAVGGLAVETAGYGGLGWVVVGISLVPVLLVVLFVDERRFGASRAQAAVA